MKRIPTEPSFFERQIDSTAGLKLRIEIYLVGLGAFDHMETNCLNSVWPIVRMLSTLPSDDVEKNALRGVLGIFVVIVATNDPFR